MSRETFVFTSATLRSLRLQQELLDWDQERRALARRHRAWKRGIRDSQRSDPPPQPEPQYCRDAAVHNALFTGDLLKIKSIFRDRAMVNVIVEVASDELVWSSELGLWTLSPKAKQTSALRITAGRGYTACTKQLLTEGANVSASPGGQCALHDATAGGHADCVQLLLTYGADPDVLSDDGRAPLHLCSTLETYQCARLLLEHGAKVNVPTKDTQATPLHVAATHGLEEHVKLYLHCGANVSIRNREGETPLNVACASAEKSDDSGRYYRVVRKLLENGADAKVAGRKKHSPLHNACANCNFRIVELLLAYGAPVNDTNYAGHTPLDCALQTLDDYATCWPEGIVRTLLNHGAFPPRPQALRLCVCSPATMEVVLNCYQSVPNVESWMDLVPAPLWQEHHTFYSSVLRMVVQPRRLQHLARCALRHHLGSLCHHTLPRLGLPPSLLNFVLLKNEGRIE
ncbi:ankyrin repeat and SOCS box protein 16 [Erpetoichthys calabaricus]|uniref:Ankyrin repeat and SOCS box containing 16 n=1 Tax=Erpetoichthys calabaricus TaxID=27687 RepID=A0A8C4TGF6_ERPCA|nr:ankyrin repeat and SOCS box protein 16 [Erpetoichthys calabaricus]